MDVALAIICRQSASPSRHEIRFSCAVEMSHPKLGRKKSQIPGCNQRKNDYGIVCDKSDKRWSHLEAPLFSLMQLRQQPIAVEFNEEEDEEKRENGVHRDGF